MNSSIHSTKYLSRHLDPPHGRRRGGAWCGRLSGGSCHEGGVGAQHGGHGGRGGGRAARSVALEEGPGGRNGLQGRRRRLQPAAAASEACKGGAAATAETQARRGGGRGGAALHGAGRVHRLTCRPRGGGGASLVRRTAHELKKVQSRSDFADEIHKLKTRLKDAHQRVISIPIATLPTTNSPERSTQI
ncbi:spidroin-1 [Brachypodium distachyon]|uniref:spidroin-1 n=1 Tax=Brachypodium distachyon TaxID=15368 RepID=UPI00071C9149|nr:spidroin-1 [Brachypodium distachyon]|eukprot:XP_014751765.1 spidroin-1 [Brachypodium distachyon]